MFGLSLLLALSSAASVYAMDGVTDVRLGLPPLPTSIHLSSPGQPTETASTALADSSAHPSAALLGQRLFFDKRLSADGKVSCGKCHIPENAFTDKLARSAGHDGKLGTRNAPSLLNVAYSDSLFWDGRAADLESQALAPLTNPVEHALASGNMLADIIRRDDGYVREFAAAFHIHREQIDAPAVGRALAAYERTLIAAGSPFDRFQYGHDRGALSAAAQRGMELFRGRAQCGTCHLIGASHALFTDGQFHMSPAGLPQSVTANLPALTRQVMDAAAQPDRSHLEHLIATEPDVAALGRFIVTRHPADIGKFRTPSLRNVALTAPYMHDGSVKTLEQAVEVELYSRTTAMNYPIALTVSEREDLVEFLRALTSPCASTTCQAPTAP